MFLGQLTNILRWNWGWSLCLCVRKPPFVDGVIRCHRNGQFSTHSWSAASIAIRISQYICLHEVIYYEDQTADLVSVQHADFRSYSAVLPNLLSCKFQTKTTAQKTQTIFLTESEQNILARDLVKRESDIKLTVSVGVLLERDIQQKDQPWCGLLHQVGLSKGQKSLLLQR